MLLSVKNKAKKSKPSLKVGTYSSIVKSINFHPDYKDDEALLVKYELTDENGKKYDFSEVFYNNIWNKRTQEFFRYLEENNVSLEQFTDFTGCEEKITLKKTVKDNRTMLSIVEREFVARASNEG